MRLTRSRVQQVAAVCANTPFSAARSRIIRSHNRQGPRHPLRVPQSIRSRPRPEGCTAPLHGPHHNRTTTPHRFPSHPWALAEDAEIVVFSSSREVPFRNAAHTVEKPRLPGTYPRSLSLPQADQRSETVMKADGFNDNLRLL